MKELRSRHWFNDPSDPGETAVYLERFNNYGITRQELQSGKPIIGIAQTGNDLVPCNRHHIQLAERVKAGIRDAGGIPFEFPGPSSSGDVQTSDRRTGSKSCVSWPRGSPRRVSSRRRCSDDRLR